MHLFLWGFIPLFFIRFLFLIRFLVFRMIQPLSLFY